MDQERGNNGALDGAFGGIAMRELHTQQFSTATRRQKEFSGHSWGFDRVRKENWLEGIVGAWE
jgi:hypothetical protein